MLFTAEHELAYFGIGAQEEGLWCGKTLRSGWGALHGEMDDLTCAYMTELGLPVSTQLLETAGSGDLGWVDGFWLLLWLGARA